METIKSVARWWILFIAVFFILTGISLLFGLSVPAVIMGLLAFIGGVLLFFSS